MSEALEIIGDVSMVPIRRDDVLVIKTIHPLPQAAAGRLLDLVRGKFPDHEILILPHGIELQIARRADDPGG